jgi:hypothetical protein
VAELPTTNVSEAEANSYFQTYIKNAESHTADIYSMGNVSTEIPTNIAQAQQVSEIVPPKVQPEVPAVVTPEIPEAAAPLEPVEVAPVVEPAGSTNVVASVPDTNEVVAPVAETPVSPTTIIPAKVQLEAPIGIPEEDNLARLTSGKPTALYHELNKASDLENIKTNGFINDNFSFTAEGKTYNAMFFSDVEPTEVTPESTVVEIKNLKIFDERGLKQGIPYPSLVDGSYNGTKYDGIISDTGSYMANSKTEVVIFEPNKLDLQNNLHPLSDVLPSEVASGSESSVVSPSEVTPSVDESTGIVGQEVTTSTKPTVLQRVKDVVTNTKNAVQKNIINPLADRLNEILPGGTISESPIVNEAVEKPLIQTLFGEPKTVSTENLVSGESITLYPGDTVKGVLNDGESESRVPKLSSDKTYYWKTSAFDGSEPQILTKNGITISPADVGGTESIYIDTDPTKVGAGISEYEVILTTGNDVPTIITRANPEEGVIQKTFNEIANNFNFGEQNAQDIEATPLQKVVTIVKDVVTNGELEGGNNIVSSSTLQDTADSIRGKYPEQLESAQNLYENVSTKVTDSISNIKDGINQAIESYDRAVVEPFDEDLFGEMPPATNEVIPKTGYGDVVQTPDGKLFRQYGYDESWHEISSDGNLDISNSVGENNLTGGQVVSYDSTTQLTDDNINIKVISSDGDPVLSPIDSPIKTSGEDNNALIEADLNDSSIPQNKLAKDRTGLELNDPDIGNKLLEDQNNLNKTYDLPDRNERITNPTQYKKDLENIAAKYNINIKYVDSNYTDAVFQQSPIARGYYDNKTNSIVIKVTDGKDVNLAELEHELIHGLQYYTNPDMPIEQAEYEAYVAANMSTDLDTINKPANKLGLFDGISGSVNHFYLENGEVDPWITPETTTDTQTGILQKVQDLYGKVTNGWDEIAVKPLNNLINKILPNANQITSIEEDEQLSMLDEPEIMAPPNTNIVLPEEKNVTIPYSKNLDSLIKVKEVYQKYGERLSTDIATKNVDDILAIAKEHGYEPKFVNIGDEVNVYPGSGGYGQSVTERLRYDNPVRIGSDGKTLYVGIDKDNSTGLYGGIEDLSHDVGAIIMGGKTASSINSIYITSEDLSDFLTQSTGVNYTPNKVDKIFGTTVINNKEYVSDTSILDRLIEGNLSSNVLDAISSPPTLFQQLIRSRDGVWFPWIKQ